MTVVGSKVELRMLAGELRAIDRPMECRKALEALKADPGVLAGELQVAPENAMAEQDVATGGEGGGGVPELPNVARSPMPISPAPATPPERSAGQGASGTAAVAMLHGSPLPETIGGVGLGQQSLQQRVNRSAVSGSGSFGGDSSVLKRRRRKRKAVVAEDGNVYDLPTYVQNVDTKYNKSTLRLKMPLSGFLVNGDDTSVADLVVAGGLEVTRQNLLALRSDRRESLQRH